MKTKSATHNLIPVGVPIFGLTLSQNKRAATTTKNNKHQCRIVHQLQFFFLCGVLLMLREKWRTLTQSGGTVLCRRAKPMNNARKTLTVPLVVGRSLRCSRVEDLHYMHRFLRCGHSE